MGLDKNHAVDKSLSDILKLRDELGAEVKFVKINAFAGEFADFPDSLSPRVAGLYRQRGIEKLYSHQARAIDEVLGGKHVVVTTPTASGKTLIYNALTLNALIKDPASKSLYLFPTKALSQDQLSELFDLNKRMGDSLGLFTYDGDTPQSTRKAIRKQAQIVITNPYMMHSGILPHHTKWINLFENLKYVVIDELHYYTGVFGSHMANIMRRLKRICAFYGSDPTFIMSSATIANPEQLAEKVIESPVSLVDRNGAPRGEKYIGFFNPPVVNRQLGIRRSYVSISRNIANILLKNQLQIITFANSRLVTEVLVKYLKNDFEKKVTEKGKIRGYRGGYLPGKRREIEQGLRSGAIQAVVSTNALELGIDIGSLDAAVLAGYPGSIASTWQRLGRAGRRSSKALGVMVASSLPIDQFIVKHPEYFSEKSPEYGRINPDNLTLLVDHIKCASFELPFRKGEGFGAEDLGEILEYLAENKVLLSKGDKWFWSEEGYPADAVSINRITSDNFVIVDTTGTERIIAEVDFGSALETLHPKAIYILEGEQYVVENFDYENRKAFVKRSNSDYYTDAITYTKISVLDVFAENRADLYNHYHGDVHVFSQVVGFKKLKFFTNENVGSGDLQLPQQEFHTTAFWLTIKENVLTDLSYPSDEIIEALSGLAYLLRHISAITLMCDIKDIGVTIEDNQTKTGLNLPLVKTPTEDFKRQQALENFEPNIYIFDNYPNGVGFSEILFEKIVPLLEGVQQTIAECPCDSGCPSCVGPPIRTGSNRKDIAHFLSKRLLNQVYQ